MNKTLERRLLTAAMVGKRGVQPLYRLLHKVSLRGRGFGIGGCEETGELQLPSELAEIDARVVFDVGANAGLWSRAALEAWPRATIHAFEPSAETFTRLCDTTKGLSVVPVHAALSDRSGQTTLFSVPDRPGFSSLSKRDMGEYGLVMSDSESVRTETLDDYCRENTVRHIDFLKIDVEGHEMDVLSGAERLLGERAIARIQFEFGGSNIDSRTFLRDFVRLLESDFDLFRILPRSTEPLRYSEREEIFMNTNFLAVRRS